ncbi:MAG: hypothetical protein NXI22_00030 [bacterium]|nr:hypothetical protein [bacterium]
MRNITKNETAKSIEISPLISQHSHSNKGVTNDFVSEHFPNTCYSTYVPHLANPFMQNLVLNPKCNFYYQLEEGIGSYKPLDTLLRLRLAANRMLSSMHYALGDEEHHRKNRRYHFAEEIRSKFRGSIATCPEAFPWISHEKRHILPGTPFDAAEEHTGSCVMLIEPILNNSSPRHKELCQKYGHCLSRKAKELNSTLAFKRFFLKSHATVDNDSLKSIDFALKERGIKATHLNPHECVEEIALSQGSALVGVYSSAMLYVNRQGGTAASIWSEICEADPHFANAIRKLPAHVKSLLGGS